MAKRFTDTNKYKKPFIRKLPGAYKLLWDYLYHDCDHAGIWIVDFEIAQLYIGDDMLVNKKEALQYFNDREIRIIEFNHGSKWFIPAFVEFQYGVLNEDNRAHKSVILILQKYNLLEKLNKPLKTPFQGCKDKDKDMDMDMDKDKDKEKASPLNEAKKDKDKEMCKKFEVLPEFYEVLLFWLKYKRVRGESYKTANSTELAYKKLLRLSSKDSIKAIKVIEQSMENNWAGLFRLDEEKQSQTSNRVRRGDTTYVDYDEKL